MYVHVCIYLCLCVIGVPLVIGAFHSKKLLYLNAFLLLSITHTHTHIHTHNTHTHNTLTHTQHTHTHTTHTFHQPPLKQSVTGRTKDNSTFPLTLSFSDCSQELSVGDLYSPTNRCNSDDEEGAERRDAALASGSSSCVPVGGGSTIPAQGGGDPRDKVISPVKQDSSTNTCPVVNAKVTIYAQLSGMISFLRDGTIHGCNHHITMMLFGYSQQELLKQVK